VLIDNIIISLGFKSSIFVFSSSPNTSGNNSYFNRIFSVISGKLPSSEVYERELSFMPYRESLRMVIDIISSKAPKKGRVIDLMCGPGWLVNKIKDRRPDLSVMRIGLQKKEL
jgi:hypothetical protein